MNETNRDSLTDLYKMPAPGTRPPPLLFFLFMGHPNYWLSILGTSIEDSEASLPFLLAGVSPTQNGG